MASEEAQPGIIPVGALYRRPSASADAARLRMIQAELRLTPDQRIVKALRLGFRDLVEQSGRRPSSF